MSRRHDLLYLPSNAAEDSASSELSPLHLALWLDSRQLPQEAGFIYSLAVAAKAEGCRISLIAPANAGKKVSGTFFSWVAIGYRSPGCRNAGPIEATANASVTPAVRNSP